MTILVVTGTGTDVGKTVATAALATTLQQHGYEVVVVKPAQTGEPEGRGDAPTVTRLTGITAVETMYRYPEPLAPATAAYRASMPCANLFTCAGRIQELEAGAAPVADTPGLPRWQGEPLPDLPPVETSARTPLQAEQTWAQGIQGHDGHTVGAHAQGDGGQSVATDTPAAFAALPDDHHTSEYPAPCHTAEHPAALPHPRHTGVHPSTHRTTAGNTAGNPAASRRIVLVEGAGGLLVRLGQDWTIATLAALLNAPLVVVSSTGLGSLNEAELTVEAARRRGLHVAGIIGGSMPSDPDLATRCNINDLPLVTGATTAGFIPAGAGSLSQEEFTRQAPSWISLPALGVAPADN